MNFGYCPSCYNQLTEESAMVTKPSEVFKGNNVYIVCKHCQRVVLYNSDRDMMFDLDDYQDDKKVLEEISKLLEDLDPNLEVAKEEVNCTGDCAACAGCEDQYHRYFSRKQEKSVPDLEPELESEPEPIKVSDEYILTDEDIQMALSNALLAVNKQDVSIKKIFLVDDLNNINVDEWVFFDLQPVRLKQVTSYEIERI